MFTIHFFRFSASRSFARRDRTWTESYRCLLMVGTAMATFASANVWAESSVRFDLARLAVGTSVVEDDSVQPLPGQRLIRVPLRISTIILSPRSPQPQQMVVRIFCTDPAVTVVDYSPRTELCSPYQGNLEVQKTAEKSKHLGLTLTGAYPGVGTGTALADAAGKDLESVRYQQVAPLELVAASGTFGRGRGVYFKLRATAMQVLEGDRQFEVILSVPDNWQAGLLDVRMTAEASRRQSGAFGAGEPQWRYVGQGDFMVTTFIDDVPEVRQAAFALADAEEAFRRAVYQYRSRQQKTKSSNLLRQVASVLEWKDPAPVQADWLGQVFRGQVDIHTDKQIRSLPVDLRVAIADYIDAREDLLNLGRVAANQLAQQ